MVKTLKAGQHRLVFTAAINNKIADDEPFAKFVWKSILRFNRGDWGDMCQEDIKHNDEDLESLNNGWDGRILANYNTPKHQVWITRNTAEEDGTQAITVMFPIEY